MSRGIKIVVVALALVAILTGVFASIALAADPTDNNLPACCQQQQGQSLPGCCGQQGSATTGNPGYGFQGRGGCCGR